MTNADQAAIAKATPHHPAKYWAFWKGRNDAGARIDGGPKATNPYSRPDLRREWNAGFNEVSGEYLLDNDTDWDN
jgi:hypothetical protein